MTPTIVERSVSERRIGLSVGPVSCVLFVAAVD